MTTLGSPGLYLQHLSLLRRAHGSAQPAPVFVPSQSLVAHFWQGRHTRATAVERAALFARLFGADTGVGPAGCELVMLCDITIAADNATFGEPEVRFSAVGPALVMPMIIGYKKARELLYLGDQIDAKTALDLGMVNRVVPLAELPEASLKFAKRLSLISPEALYATKRAVNRVADAAGFRTALYAGLDVVGPLYATTTELGARFRQIATTQGVPAAVRWRSAQFKE